MALGRAVPTLVHHTIIVDLQLILVITLLLSATSLRSKRNIRNGEELFLSYGNNYKHPHQEGYSYKKKDLSN
jgi:hypothetical protein